MQSMYGVLPYPLGTSHRYGQTTVCRSCSFAFHMSSPYCCDNLTKCVYCCTMCHSDSRSNDIYIYILQYCIIIIIQYILWTPFWMAMIAYIPILFYHFYTPMSFYPETTWLQNSTWFSYKELEVWLSFHSIIHYRISIILMISIDIYK